jgi:hypothetical protein
LDVGELDWTPDGFRSFLTTLCRSSRQRPFTLKLDSCRFSSQWDETLSKLPTDIFRPVITELDLSHNSINGAAFAPLLKFLATQYGDPPHRLMYLSLSGSIAEAIGNSLLALTDFLSTRGIWGLALADVCTLRHGDLATDLIEQLRLVPGLVSLDLAGTFIPEAAVTSFLRFVRDSKSIAEVSLDRSRIDDVDHLLAIYESLAHSTKVLAMRSPVSDLAPFAGDADAQAVLGQIAKKRPVASARDRLQLYLSLFGDFETRLPNLSPGLTENRLFESDFRNPIPSVFQVTRDAEADAESDPLASLAVESAVGGKYGVLPPTVAPATPPAFGLTVPAIFGTVELPHDPAAARMNPEMDLSMISLELAPSIQAHAGMTVSVFAQHTVFEPKVVAILPVVKFSQ